MSLIQDVCGSTFSFLKFQADMFSQASEFIGDAKATGMDGLTAA